MKDVKLHNLFDAARLEAAPAVDVADGVLAALAVQRQAAALLSRSLMWMSMASSAIAAGVVVAVLLYGRQTTDAVGELLNMVAWVAQ